MPRPNVLLSAFSIDREPSGVYRVVFIEWLPSSEITPQISPVQWPPPLFSLKS